MSKKLSPVSRRSFLSYGVGSAAGLIGATALNSLTLGQAQAQQTPTPEPHDMAGMDGMDMGSGTTAAGDTAYSGHGSQMLMGAVDHERNGFDPMQMLVDWDYGTLSTDEQGRTVREYKVSSGDIDIEIAPGVFFPAWSFNARVPGTSIRCTEGDHLKINFANYGSHPHTMHFHGFHTADMDGVPGIGRGAINPGETFTYEFDAEPFGCHLYHCHAQPLKRHIHKGMYGAFIIDPKQARAPAREMMMIMNAFDTNFDSANEVYAINTVGHEFMRRPIPVKVGELIRVYLINVIEFDLINSFHIHGNFFNYYDHGTTMEPTLRMVDTIMQAQGQRGILEFTFRWPGQYMFHAHVSEFAELGWMGLFNAVAPADYDAALAEVGLDAEWDRKGTQGSSLLQSGGK